jgi:hypothetical protein
MTYIITLLPTKKPFLWLTIHGTRSPSTLPNCYTICKKMEIAGAAIRYPDDYLHCCVLFSIQIIIQ